MIKKIFNFIKENQMSFLFSIYFIGSSMLSILSILCRIIGFSHSSIFTLLFYAFIGLYLLLSIKKIIKIFNWKDGLFFFGIFLIFTVSVVLNEQNVIYLTENVKSIALSCIPMYLLFRVIPYKKSNTHLILFVSSLITLFLQFITAIDLYVSTSNGLDEMALPYEILLHTSIVSSYMFVNHKKIFKFIGLGISILSSIVMFFLGSRGPIFILLAYLATAFLYNKRLSKKKYIIIGSIAGGVIILFLALSSFIFAGLNVLFTKLGLQGRMFEISSLSELFSLRGRNELNRSFYLTIGFNPNIGFGFFGDYYLTAGSRYNKGLYLHNIIYGIMSSFGIFGGLIILYFIFLILKKTYKTLRLTKTLQLFIAIIFLSIVKLMFSGTYVTEKMFWILISFCISVLEIEYNNDDSYMDHSIDEREIYTLEI